MAQLNPIVTQWLTYLERQGKSEATIASYRLAMNHFSSSTPS